jgi:hypothetical protein
MTEFRPAFLLRDVMNTISVGPTREEQASSGLYTLTDLACLSCGALLGWRYVRCLEAGPEMQCKERCSLLAQTALRASPSRNSLAAAREHIEQVQAAGSSLSSRQREWSRMLSSGIGTTQRARHELTRTREVGP